MDNPASTDGPAAFVIGWPITHSRSPLIHRYWLERHGLAGSYRAIPVEPDDCAEFLSNLPDSSYVGGNVTLPLKEQVFSILTKLDPAAGAIGSVNTLWMENGVVCGGNTDAHGFSANLDANAAGWRDAETALVFGAGGGARAVLFSLLEGGVGKIHLFNRTYERAQKLAAFFGPRVVATPVDGIDAIAAHSDLAVNTSALGMNGEGEPPIPVALLPDSAIVSDIVYTPLTTPLLARARARDLRIVDGLGMLLHQAVPGFERWFGQRPVVDDPLRNHILEQIGDGS